MAEFGHGDGDGAGAVDVDSYAAAAALACHWDDTVAEELSSGPLQLPLLPHEYPAVAAAAPEDWPFVHFRQCFECALDPVPLDTYSFLRHCPSDTHSAE